MSLRKGHAIVIGSGISGLLTARVLSDSFERVTVVEKDRSPAPYDISTFRKGIPQAMHVHGLLSEGLKVFFTYFPDLEAQFGRDQIPKLEDGVDNPTCTKGMWLSQRPTGVTLYTASRMYIENTIRARVEKLPNVSFLYSHAVAELIFDSSRNLVHGVTVEAQGAVNPADTARKQILAELVVDASGRNTRLSAWLKTIGVEVPAPYVCSKDLGYSSRFYRLPKRKRNWKALFVRSAKNKNMGFVMFEIDGGLHHLTLRGGSENYPPAKEVEFLEFAKQIDKELGMELLYPELENAVAMSDIKIFRNMDCVRKSYSDVSNWPKGLLAVGDSIAYLDPTFGQGMSVSAIGVRLLEKLPLHDLSTTNWAAQYFRDYVNLASAAWWMASGGDLVPTNGRDEGTGSLRRMKKRLARAYFEFCTRLGKDSKTFFLVYTQVKHCMAPASRLVSPTLLLRGFFEAAFYRIVTVSFMPQRIRSACIRPAHLPTFEKMQMSFDEKIEDKKDDRACG